MLSSPALSTLSLAAILAATPAPSNADGFPLSRNASGLAATVSTQGRIDHANPFFQSLGANGRSCASCHVEDQGWTITPEKVRRRFDATQGTDPIFRTVDGSNSPNDDVSTPAARRRAYSMPLNIGIVDASRRTPDLPLYTLRNKTTGETVQVTDPGRALVTGRWADIGRFKGPVLRALATRAPYFHNGFAADLPAVVDFYNTRFDIRLTDQEKADLVAFPRTL